MYGCSECVVEIRMPTWEDHARRASDTPKDESVGGEACMLAFKSF